jgi:hypothetical protein
MLIAILKYEKARQTFKFDTHKGVPILFIDINKSFNSCKFDIFYNRKVEITTDSSFLNQSNPSNIVVFGLKVSGKRYKIEIQQKYTGAYGFIEFRKKGQRFTITNFSVGYF